MSDEVDRHFQATKRLARAQATSMWLKTQYDLLDRQVRVMDALYQASQHLYEPRQADSKEAERLCSHAARCVLATCEAIMRHSGLAGLDHSDWGDQAASESGEAREESLPW